MDNAKKMAATLTERPGYALQTIKRVVNEGMQLDLNSALASEMRSFALLFSTQDKIEGIKAFVENWIRITKPQHIQYVPAVRNANPP